MPAAAYRAFISYSHADTRWAKWLHGRLEGYRIDRDLVGRATSMGPIPASLRPVFRDRDDFAAGHTVTEQTLAALDASAALIVLCSPDAASSHYVNEEVRLFKQRHPDRPVIPAILAGRPGGAPSPRVRGEGRGEGQLQTPAPAPAPNPLPIEVMGRGDAECFPPALRLEVGADGALGDKPAELLAA